MNSWRGRITRCSSGTGSTPTVSTSSDIRLVYVARVETSSSDTIVSPWSTWLLRDGCFARATAGQSTNSFRKIGVSDRTVDGFRLVCRGDPDEALRHSQPSRKSTDRSFRTGTREAVRRSLPGVQTSPAGLPQDHRPKWTVRLPRALR